MKMVHAASAATKRVALAGSAALGLAMVGFMLAGPASAAESDPGLAAFDDLQGKATLYGAATIGLVVVVIGLFFAIKMLKRGASKA